MVHQHEWEIEYFETQRVKGKKRKRTPQVREKKEEAQEEITTQKEEAKLE